MLTTHMDPILFDICNPAVGNLVAPLSASAGDGARSDRSLLEMPETEDWGSIRKKMRRGKLGLH